MPVTQQHPEYTKYLPMWVKARVFIQGEEAVKAAGPDYLPMLEGQDENEYIAYKMRAMFYAAADRTVKGLTGALLRKPTAIEAPDMLKNVLSTIGTCGESFDQIQKTVVRESIGVGRIGMLVDAPADVEGAPPSIIFYFAENIINWREQVIGGKRKKVRVVLKEEYEVPADDNFQYKCATQYRVLRLGMPSPGDVNVLEKIDEGEISLQEAMNLVYWVEIYRKHENSDDSNQENKDDEWELYDTIFPRAAGGKLLDEIPFEVVSEDGVSLTGCKPPIMDLVNVNASHYRNSADLEHGRHFTALPTAVASGFDPKTAALKIGSSVVWISPEPTAHATFLEFTGAGLGHLQTACESKEKLMAILGSRLLEERQPGVEAADTVRLRQAGEQSVLANISDACSEGLTQVLRWVGFWIGVAEAEEANIAVKLNKDFNLVGADFRALTLMMQALQSGFISWNTWFYNLQRADIVPEDIEAQDEARLISAGSPAGFVAPPLTPEEQAAIDAQAQADAIASQNQQNNTPQNQGQAA